MSILIAEIPVGQLVVEGDDPPGVLVATQAVATLVAVAEQGPGGGPGTPGAPGAPGPPGPATIPDILDGGNF